MDIRKIYEYALQREIEGKRFFEKNSERMSHAAAAEAFRQLAAEEQKHIEFIQSQIKKLDQDQNREPDLAQIQDTDFFSKRAISEVLEQSVLEAMVPDLPILRMAYLIERDFAEFYEMSAKKAEGDAKKVLETLARWERQHETLFKKMHDNAFEQYTQMPWGG